MPFGTTISSMQCIIPSPSPRPGPATLCVLSMKPPALGSPRERSGRPGSLTLVSFPAHDVSEAHPCRSRCQPSSSVWLNTVPWWLDHSVFVLLFMFFGEYTH